MRKWFTHLFPRAELAAKQRQIDTLMVSLKNASDKAADLQRKYEEALERESETNKELRSALKSVANYAVYAGGSKVPIFDGAGPTLPHREPVQPVQPGQTQAKKHIRNLSSFLQEKEAAFRASFAQDLANDMQSAVSEETIQTQ